MLLPAGSWRSGRSRRTARTAGTSTTRSSSPLLRNSLDFSTVNGVYITLNEVAPALLARRANRVKMRLGRKDATTADSDIVRRRWFPVDIDPVRPSGVSSTAEEHALALKKAEDLAAWLGEHGFPEPVRGDSGNGAHLLYRVDLPNDDDSRQLVQQALAVLSALFSDERCSIDTAVYNAGRIWKLYGTVSRKGDWTADRPYRRSRLVSVPEPVAVVPREILGALSQLLPEAESARNGSPVIPKIRQQPSAGGIPGSIAKYSGQIRESYADRNSSTSSSTRNQALHKTKVYDDPLVPIDLPGWFREHGIRVRSEKPWNGGRLFILEECPFSGAHRDGAFAIQFGNGAVHAGCKHAGCGGGRQRWQELRMMHEKEYAERMDTRQSPGNDPYGRDHQEHQLSRDNPEAPVSMDTRRPPGNDPYSRDQPEIRNNHKLLGNNPEAPVSMDNRLPGNDPDTRDQPDSTLRPEPYPEDQEQSPRNETGEIAYITGERGAGDSDYAKESESSRVQGIGGSSAQQNGRTVSTPVREQPAYSPDQLVDVKENKHSGPSRERALAILRDGDPGRFILGTFAKCHVGDGIVAACYLASTLSSSVQNSRGLHVCPTGDSGKGKSDSAHAFLRLLPEPAKMQGSITPKALFYHTLDPGTVIIFDDFAMNEDIREVLKNATSGFQQPLAHFTLNANRLPVVLSLPPRCVWWILSVDNPGDDQVLNRMMNPWIDDSEQQDRRVRDHIFARARLSAGTKEEEDDQAVCREIFAIIREHLFTVRVPFAHRIRMDSIRNRRNPIMLLDIIRSHAVLKFMQRPSRTLPDGSIEIDATEEDFSNAADLFTALDTTSGGQTSKLLKNEQLLVDSVIAMGKNEFTIRDAQAWMGLSHNVIRRIIHGRPDRDGVPGGLLAKCPALGYIETTTSEGSLESITRRRENHYIFNYEQYKSWNRSNGVWLVPDEQDQGVQDMNDPEDPMGSGWDQVGILTGIRSKPMENATILNLDNNILNNSTGTPSRSHNQESAVASLSAQIQNSDFDQKNPPACDPEELGSSDDNISQNGDIAKIITDIENQQIPDLIPNRSLVGSWDQIREQDYVALPFESPVPCHVCGKSPTTSLKITPGDPPDQYLCYECLKRAREKPRPHSDKPDRMKRSREKERSRSDIPDHPEDSRAKERSPDNNTIRSSGTIPIPGILDHRDFHRLNVSVGRCDICGENEAVYRNPTKRTKCCEQCYGRLVREGNRAEGAG